MFRALSKTFSSQIPKHSTTILAVKKGNEVFLIGDGQVSQGYTVVKSNARKVREIRKGIAIGFAGSVADAFALMEILEGELDKYEGFPVIKACTEMAK